MEKIIISFIVPLYNEEKVLAMCLDSIVSVMEENDEIIVVDNGSKDKSIEIVRGYRRVALMIRPNVTIGTLRNAGAMVARGDIFSFIDADCVVGNNWRCQVVNVFRNPVVAACGSKYGLPFNSHWIETAWFSQKKISAGPVNYINSGNLAVSKVAFNKIGGFDENLVTGEDAEFCSRLRLNGYVVFEDPNIKAIHLGNPKDLLNFYKKQRWHGLGMFGTFKISLLDKPVIMTIVFMFCSLFAFSSFLECLNSGESFSLILPISLVLFVPILTSLYRCFQYKNFFHFFQLILLYFLYYVARAEAIVRIVYSKIFKDYIRKTAS